MNWKRTMWTGHVASMGEKNSSKILVAKPEGKIQSRRPGSRWQGNVKQYFKKKGFKGVEWIHQPQSPVQGSCEHDSGSSVSW